MLYKILTSNRIMLLDFLTRIPFYDKWNLLMKDILLKHENVSLKSLLFGHVGLEINKQMAIYAIPTYEFMLFVFTLQKIFNIRDIKELHAGLGLFSRMYKYFLSPMHQSGYADTSINAYDGCRCLETSTHLKFYDVQHSSVEKFIIDRIDLSHSMCVSIMTANLSKSISKFMEVCKPVCYIIVGSDTELDDISQRLDHSITCLRTSVKILSFLDNCLIPE